MGRSGKGIATSLTLITKRPNMKQNSRTAITDNNNQYLMNFFNKFNTLPYIYCNKK